MQEKEAWVQVGFDGGRSRKQDPCPWRCFFGEDPTVFWVKGIEVKLPIDATGCWMTGKSTTENANGLLGWFQWYGICSIQDDILHIRPKTPLNPPPKRQDPH